MFQYNWQKFTPQDRGLKCFIGQAQLMNERATLGATEAKTDQLFS